MDTPQSSGKPAGHNLGNPDKRVSVILSGAMARPKVLQALFQDKDVKMEQIKLKDYGLRIQEIDDIGPQTVRDDMKKVWEGRNYMGAVGVVKAEGEEADVTLVKTTLEGWTKANRLLQEFNYHVNHELDEEGKEIKMPWFHNEIIGLPDEIKGEFNFIETFADTNKLQKVKDVYPDNKDYEEKLDELEPIMAGDMTGFREGYFKEIVAAREGGKASGAEDKG